MKQNLNWFQKFLIKIASNYLKKHKAISIDLESNIILHGEIFTISSYDFRKSVHELPSIRLEALSPIRKMTMK